MAKTRFSSIQLEPSTNKDDTEALKVVNTAGQTKFKVNMDGSFQAGDFQVGADGYFAAGGFKVLTATVGTTETEVEHGLGRVPYIVLVCPVSASAAYVCQTKAPDNAKIYLIASAANTSTKIYVA